MQSVTDSMNNELHLWGKKVLLDKSPIIMCYHPAEDWLDYWTVALGKWEYKDGYLIGSERKSYAAMLLSKQRFEGDIMFSFNVQTVLPATRDLNALFCANWDLEKNDLGESYVCGLNGWYEHKSGIERNGKSNLYTTTSLYQYVPGTEVHMDVGVIHGHSFMMVDGQMVTELVDPEPLVGGHVGFSAYCTMLKIRDIEVRQLVWEPFPQEYEPEF